MTHLKKKVTGNLEGAPFHFICVVAFKWPFKRDRAPLEIQKYQTWKRSVTNKTGLAIRHNICDAKRDTLRCNCFA